MQYILYNATKDKRLPGEFEYRDILFSRSSFGRILRMLLDTEWSGDKIAVLPVDKWEKDQKNLEKAGISRDPVDAPVQSIVFETFDASIPEYVYNTFLDTTTYVKYDTGSFYSVDKHERINRFDALIPLISIDPPTHLMETFYVEVNGLWAFEPLYATDVKPDGEDMSTKYDVENFYRGFKDNVIRHKINGQIIPDGGLWVGDMISLIEEE